MLVVAALVVVVFVGRLVQIQIVRGSDLAAEAQAVRMQRNESLAHRGDILDADGEVLATSVDRYTIAADQNAIASFLPRTYDEVDGEPLREGGAAGVAKLLAPILGVPAPELAAQLNGSSGYKVLRKDVVPEVQRAIADLNLKAYISMVPTTQRMYPAGDVGANVVGFVGSDEAGTVSGRAGVEFAAQENLSGTDGVEVNEVGRGGQLIPTGAQERVAAVNGQDVQLTLVRDIQWKAQDAVDTAVADTGAQWGIAVVMDNRTGALLALADSGTVDPNASSSTKGDASRAVANIFDPGSTGKVITMCAILDGGYATPTSQFTVADRYTTPNGQTFKDSHDHPVKRWTLAGILAESSNTGTVEVGMQVPKQTRYDYLHAFGFGQSTGLGLPGESAGILRPADQWDGRTQYAVLFGQGVSVNAVQATSVFSTVANGGVRMTPHVIAGTSVDGELSEASIPEGTRVVSSETADTVLQMMESVVEDGTGKAAAVDGYRIAGKTGTAEAAGPDGRLDGIVASFIGVAPADDPRYTVSVFLKDPKTSIYGGDVAAPVFSDIMAFTLQHMNVPPSTQPFDPFPTTW